MTGVFGPVVDGKSSMWIGEFIRCSFCPRDLKLLIVRL